MELAGAMNYVRLAIGLRIRVKSPHSVYAPRHASHEQLRKATVCVERRAYFERVLLC